MLVFSPADASDIEEIVGVVNRAYSPLPDAPGWAGERSFQRGDRTDHREVEGLVTSPAGAVLVGRRAGRIVSCCHVTLRDSITAYLGLFAVDPDQQGGGAGRRTMDYGESCARLELGVTRMTIDVMEHHEPLRQWYSRIGYQVTGSRKPFPGNAGQGLAWLIEMQKSLEHGPPRSTTQ